MLMRGQHAPAEKRATKTGLEVNVGWRPSLVWEFASKDWFQSGPPEEA